MHRAVLQACWPWFFWLCVASGLMLLLVQFCGGRINWSRLRRLPKGEEGAVQSLALVLTLPVFLMLVLFIVQVTQIMVGIMMVNYAAFAAARAASVWIPADVTTDMTFKDPPFDGAGIMNALTALDGIADPNFESNPLESLTLGPLESANVLAGVVDGSELPGGGMATMTAVNGANSFKYQKIFLAGVIPCLTISPSRSTDSSMQLPQSLQNTYSALTKLYPLVDPASKSNSRMPRRLQNKLNYAAKFTTVDITWQNVAHPFPDTAEGPTYNPFMHPSPGIRNWMPNEVGFRDPVTVVVRHQFALLPGIGRILATPVQPVGASQSKSDPGYDRAASRITRRPAGTTELYTLELEASATFVNEGFKSIFRYAVQP